MQYMYLQLAHCATLALMRAEQPTGKIARPVEERGCRYLLRWGYYISVAGVVAIEKGVSQAEKGWRTRVFCIQYPRRNRAALKEDFPSASVDLKGEMNFAALARD